MSKAAMEAVTAKAEQEAKALQADDAFYKRRFNNEVHRKKAGWVKGA